MQLDIGIRFLGKNILHLVMGDVRMVNLFW